MLRALADTVGSTHVVTDPDVLAARSVDHTGRYRGRASALVRPGSAEQLAEVLRVCRDAGAHVTVQGDVAGGRDGARARRRVAVHRTAAPHRRRRHRRASHRGRRRGHAGRGAAGRVGRQPGVRRGPRGPRQRDRRRHGLHECRWAAHCSVRQHGRAGARHPGRQHRLRPARAVRRRRGHAGRDHRAGPATAPHPDAHGDGDLRVRRPRCRGGRRAHVPRRGRHRGAGIDRRPGGCADPRASRRARLGRRRLAAGGIGRRSAANRPSAWMPLRGNGCGRSGRRWPRCSACTGRR